MRGMPLAGLTLKNYSIFTVNKNENEIQFPQIYAIAIDVYIDHSRMRQQG